MVSVSHTSRTPTADISAWDQRSVFGAVIILVVLRIGGAADQPLLLAIKGNVDDGIFGRVLAGPPTEAPAAEAAPAPTGDSTRA